MDYLVGIWVRIHTALFLFGVFGLFGICVDVDSLWGVIQARVPITLDSILTHGTRIFHFPILLVCGLTVLFLGSCLAGLLFDAITVELGCYKE